MPDESLHEFVQAFLLFIHYEKFSVQKTIFEGCSGGN